MSNSVYIVEDNSQVCEAIARLIGDEKVFTKSFFSAEEFLESEKSPGDGCIITDYKLPGITGLDLLIHLRSKGVQTPVILLTAYANTPLILDAVKHGALTIIDKPYDENQLSQAIFNAFEVCENNKKEDGISLSIKQKVSFLTIDESKLLKMLLKGTTNKEAAFEFKVSVRTIELRRHNIFKKLGVTSLVEVMNLLWKARMSDYLQYDEI